MYGDVPEIDITYSAAAMMNGMCCWSIVHAVRFKTRSRYMGCAIYLCIVSDQSHVPLASSTCDRPTGIPDQRYGTVASRKLSCGCNPPTYLGKMNMQILVASRDAEYFCCIRQILAISKCGFLAAPIGLAYLPLIRHPSMSKGRLFASLEVSRSSSCMLDMRCIIYVLIRSYLPH